MHFRTIKTQLWLIQGLYVFAISFLVETWTPYAMSQTSDGYEPPNTPELYEKNPDGPGQKVDYGSNFYLGFGLGLGQSQSNADKANPIASYNLDIEVGYQSKLQSSRLIESSITFFTGKAGHSRAEVDIGVGFLARLGYGYKIGNNLWGVWKAGGGLVSGMYEGKTADGFKVENEDSISGTMVQGGFYLISEQSALSYYGGLKWTYYNFGLSSATYTDASGQEQEIDENIGVSVPELEIGARLSF